MVEDGQRISSKFVIKLQGKDYVLFEGLLDLAHKEGLKRVSTNLLQIPHQDNGMVAIVQAEAETGKGVFSGIGDASPDSVSHTLVPHLIRMAETRAIARALRFAVNIGITTFEELGEVEQQAAEQEQPEMRQPENLILHFGKYYNRSLGEIYEEDPSYLEWLSLNARDSEVREAAKKTIEKKENFLS